MGGELPLIQLSGILSHSGLSILDRMKVLQAAAVDFNQNESRLFETKININILFAPWLILLQI